MLRTPGAGPAQHRESLLPRGRKPRQHKPAEKKVVAGTEQNESRKAPGTVLYLAMKNHLPLTLPRPFMLSLPEQEVGPDDLLRSLPTSASL